MGDDDKAAEEIAAAELTIVSWERCHAELRARLQQLEEMTASARPEFTNRWFEAGILLERLRGHCERLQAQLDLVRRNRG